MTRIVCDDLYDFLEEGEELVTKIDQLIFDSHLNVPSVYTALACNVCNVIKNTSENKQDQVASWESFKRIVELLLED